MRSRFTAFCLKDADYLLASLHKEPRAKDSRKALLRSFGGTQWRSLKVIRCQQGICGQQSGEVEFAAFYLDGDTSGQLHERSRFVFEEGCWFYVDGDILPPISLARNEACWCGSGRKLKKCHPE
jgi:SEC-C motif-containing protein